MKVEWEPSPCHGDGTSDCTAVHDQVLADDVLWASLAISHLRPERKGLV